MTNNLDCRDLMIIDNTIANMNLVEENGKLQNNFNSLLITVVIVGVAAIGVGIYLQHYYKTKLKNNDSAT